MKINRPIVEGCGCYYIWSGKTNDRGGAILRIFHEKCDLKHTSLAEFKAWQQQDWQKWREKTVLPPVSKQGSPSQDEIDDANYSDYGAAMQG